MVSGAKSAVCAVVIVAASFGFAPGAAAQDFAPARLLHLPVEHLPCPSGEQPSPLIVCRATVPKNGWMTNRGAAQCLVDGDPALAALISSRVLLAEFEPARVDGRRARVRTLFRLGFTEENGACSVTYVPNIGTQQNELGADYFDPQEIVTRTDWVSRARPHWRGPGAEGMVFSLSVAVDARGNASDGRVERNNFASDATMTASVRALEKSKFVPAFVDGVAQPSRFFDFFYVARSCGSDEPTRADPDRC